MTMSTALLLAAIVAVVGLVIWYRRSRDNDRFAGIVARHRETAKISSHAELIDGRNHIPVALTLEQEQICYENEDIDAKLDISMIDEVEYASDLLTGTTANGSVLRLRAHGRAVEFVLDKVSAEKWSHLLPPHRIDEAGSVHAV